MASLSPKKSLGQHFLKCGWVVSALIKAAEIGPEDTVLEVGPGGGILTRALAASAKKVVAVEKDEALAESLRNELAQEQIKNVEIVTGDILKLLTDQEFSYKLKAISYKLVSNIPYYLTSRLIRIFLEHENPPQQIVLTIQKEVAQRIVATPPDMNLLCLSVQAYGTPEVVRMVPRECFSPKPKVDSAIVRISSVSTRFFEAHSLDPVTFFALPRQAFTLKRKTMLNALGKAYPKAAREAALAAAKIDPVRRPQELTLEEWAILAKEIGKTSDKPAF